MASINGLTTLIGGCSPLLYHLHGQNDKVKEKILFTDLKFPIDDGNDFTIFIII